MVHGLEVLRIINDGYVEDLFAGVLAVPLVAERLESLHYFFAVAVMT